MEKNIYTIIQDWHKLLENGTITENEFVKKKNELLNIEKAKTVTRQPNKKGIPTLNLAVGVVMAFLLSFYIYYYYVRPIDNEFETNYYEPESVMQTDGLGFYLINDFVTDRAHFYEWPDSSTKKKAYVTEGDEINVEKIIDGFGYVEFTNSQGQITKGWLKMEELKDCDYCE